MSTFDSYVDSYVDISHHDQWSLPQSESVDWAPLLARLKSPALALNVVVILVILRSPDLA